MNLNKTVIKVLNKEHGAKVIQWFKDQGVDAGTLDGKGVSFYYGVRDTKQLDCWPYLPSGYTVIELPSEQHELPKRGDKILVWNDFQNPKERTFLAYIEDTRYPVITVCEGHETNFKNNKKVSTMNWEHYKLIEPKKEISFTVQEIADKLGITLEQVKEMKIIFGQEQK